MQTATTTDPRGALCAAASDAAAVATTPTAQPLFPPKDADAEARRRWLASSPWPEVVFAVAGA